MCKTDNKSKKLYYFFAAQQNVQQKPRKLNMASQAIQNG